MPERLSSKEREHHFSVSVASKPPFNEKEALVRSTMRLRCSSDLLLAVGSSRMRVSSGQSSVRCRKGKLVHGGPGRTGLRKPWMRDSQLCVNQTKTVRQETAGHNDVSGKPPQSIDRMASDAG